MTFVEELLRETDQMRSEGKTAEEIKAYVKRAVAENNKRVFDSLRRQERFAMAVAAQ